MKPYGQPRVAADFSWSGWQDKLWIYRFAWSGGKRLLRSRGEKLERTFAHCYETGGMRRVYLRGKDNIAKQTIIHAAGFNVGLLIRVSYDLRKPQSGSGSSAR
jgi:hypothetical protein